MTPNRDELQAQAATRGKDHNSRRLLLLLSIVLVLSLITCGIGGVLLWNEKQAQALAGKDLAIKVQQACVDPALANDLGKLCSEAERVEEKIKAGPQGPPGIAGPQGPSGSDGVDGADGADGKNGKNGRDGVDGVDGEDGAPGPAGPAGPSGQDGKDGQDGQPGQDAFPMSWTFEFSPNPAQKYNFLCTLIHPSEQVSCISQ